MACPECCGCIVDVNTLASTLYATFSLASGTCAPKFNNKTVALTLTTPGNYSYTGSFTSDWETCGPEYSELRLLAPTPTESHWDLSMALRAKSPPDFPGQFCCFNSPLGCYFNPYMFRSLTPWLHHNLSCDPFIVTFYIKDGDERITFCEDCCTDPMLGLVITITE